MDVATFEDLLQTQRNRVFTYACYALGDREEAADVTQEAFVRVWNRCPTDEPARALAWLRRIARNLCIDHQRKMKFRLHASLDQPQAGSDRAIAARAPNPGPSTEALAAGGLLRERIASAVERLPDEQREVFLLRQLQGLAFHEIAEVVGVPANTVKSRMRYALERLQRTLRDWEEHDEL